MWSLVNRGRSLFVPPWWETGIVGRGVASSQPHLTKTHVLVQALSSGHETWLLGEVRRLLQHSLTDLRVGIVLLFDQVELPLHVVLFTD
jgi:hypothetical protein